VNESHELLFYAMLRNNCSDPGHRRLWSRDIGLAGREADYFRVRISEQNTANCSKPELNYSPAKGAVRAPWTVWRPYLWADGLMGRKDGRVVWKREDLGPDGTHPSMLGREKVARLLMNFLKTDLTSRTWFVKQ
jgi:hypothetical protein